MTQATTFLVKNTYSNKIKLCIYLLFGAFEELETVHYHSSVYINWLNKRLS